MADKLDIAPRSLENGDAGCAPKAPFAEKRPPCILCGKCLEVCPLFQATGREELSPKAKFFLADSLEAPGEDLSEKAAARLAGLCLSCGRCEKACPRGLCAPHLVARLRAAHPGWRGHVWDAWLSRPGLLWPMARALSKLVPSSLPSAGHMAAMDPARAPAPFLRPVRFGQAAKGLRVALFAGCMGAHARADWAEKSRELLAGLGADLVPDPGFSCCGASLGHAGLPDSQTAARRANIKAWREAGRPLLAVFCATCRCGLRAYAGWAGDFEPGEAVRFRESVVNLPDLLAGTEFEILPDAPREIIYHRPCHGSGGDRDLRFLQGIFAERLRFFKENGPCCGFGGLMRLTAPGLSDRVAQRAMEAYAPAPGAHILTGCSGCAVQLFANAPPGVAAGHWLDAICHGGKAHI